LLFYSTAVGRLETIDGTAEAVKDYIPVKQSLVFNPDETLQHVDIAIVDDNEWEPDEVFFVKLSLDPEDPDSKMAVLGKRAIQEITILNDDGL
jgi:solute carrier family 8 (sodium/calcium exchanger)